MTVKLETFSVKTALAGAAVAFGMTLAPLAATAQGVTIKLAHPNVPKHPMGQGFEYFKELVSERSDGAIEVTILDSSKIGNFDSLVQGLQSGLLQMGSASRPNLAPFSKDSLIFDMPFLIPSYEAADLITDGEIGQAAARALEPTGNCGMGHIEIGFRHNFNSTQPVEKLSDMDAMKVRSTPSKAHIATLQALGANPTPIAWSEVQTALQQQTVDGIDIDLNLAWANNFHEVTENLTLVGSLYSPHLVMASQIWWQGLRAIGVREIWEILKSTVLNTAQIFFLVTTATALGQILLFNSVPDMMVDLMTSISDNRCVLLVLIIILLLVVGTFMDALANILILTPLLLPVIRKVGIDPIHFGIVMIVSIAIGFLPPPAGVNLFVGCSIGQIPIKRLSVAVLPFLGAMLLALLVLAFVPQISLILL